MFWFGLVLLRINVALAIFQPYRDLEAGDNQVSEIQVARRGIEPRTSCSASQELNNSATAAPVPCSSQLEWQLLEMKSSTTFIRGNKCTRETFVQFIFPIE